MKELLCVKKLRSEEMNTAKRCFLVLLALGFVFISGTAQAEIQLGYGTGINAADSSHQYNTIRKALRTVDKSGLSGDQHNTDPDAMWYSGTLSNPAENEPWIMYTFDTTYVLTRMWVWNFNQVIGTDPFGTKYGLNHIRIEYSIDSGLWETLIDPNDNGYFVLEKAPGANGYEPSTSDKIDLGNIIAKYIRITPVGGPGVGNFDTSEYLERYGLSEVRFYADSEWINPNAKDPTPANVSTIDDPNIILMWTPGPGAVTQDVYFGTSQGSMSLIENDIPASTNSIPLGVLSNGNYYWRVDKFDGSTTLQGDLWTFELAVKASVPSPANEFEVGTGPIRLSWTPPAGAASQKLYIGEDLGSMVLVAEGDADMSFYYTEKLKDKTTYYWRVDIITEDESVAIGDTWNFSTKFRLSWIASLGEGRGIASVDASVGNGGNPGHQALDGSGMVINDDVHVAATAENRWYYRLPPPTENALFTVHFDQGYKLNEMWIWNHTGPQALKKVNVEHSMDGKNWTSLINPDPASTSGDPNLFVFEMGQSSGLPSNLENDYVIDFNGVRAKHVRLIARGGIGEGNYETSTSYGYMLHELRFYCKTPVLYCDKNYSNDVDLTDFAVLAGDWQEDMYSEAPSLMIDDFESYNVDPDPNFNDDPADGGWVLAPWAHRECPDGTTLSISDNVAHSGSQSLRIDYDGSEASGLAYHSILYNFGGGSTPNMDLRDYAYLEWWQYNAPGNDDVKYRVLWFGEWISSDPDYMYAAIAPDMYWTDPKTWSEQVVAPAGEWFLVRLDLSGVSDSLLNCDAFVIKCDTTDPGYTGVGTIYYDDVKFVSPHCTGEIAGDVTGDCRVNMLDLVTFAEEWLLTN